MKTIKQYIDFALLAKGEMLDKKLHEVREILGYSSSESEEEEFFIIMLSENMVDPENFQPPLYRLKEEAKDASSMFFEGGKDTCEEEMGKRVLLHKLEQMDRYLTE